MQGPLQALCTFILITAHQDIWAMQVCLIHSACNHVRMPTTIVLQKTTLLMYNVTGCDRHTRSPLTSSTTKHNPLAQRAGCGCPLLPEPGADAVSVEVVLAGQRCNTGTLSIPFQADAAAAVLRMQVPSWLSSSGLSMHDDNQKAAIQLSVKLHESLNAAKTTPSPASRCCARVHRAPQQHSPWPWQSRAHACAAC